MTPAFAGVGDFNGDGKPDLLAVSSSVTTILFQTPATPRVVGARAIADADAVFSVKGRVKLLAADGSRAAVTTSLKKGCGRIVIWRASSRTSSPVNPGFLGCDGDGVTQLAVGDGRVGWIEEGGGNNLEMTVMTAKLGGGAAKQIEYEANGDRAGAEKTIHCCGSRGSSSFASLAGADLSSAAVRPRTPWQLWEAAGWRSRRPAP